MKKMLLLGGCFALILSALVPAGCYYDNEEDLYGNADCNVDSARYGADIVPLLQANCYKCHVASAPDFSGIPLDSYAALKAYATDGKLVSRTSSTSAPMPPLSEGGLMPACDQEIIKVWVDAGAPNN
jgi:hypothetical protein